MNVASLELCKELYELSGWHKTDYYYDAENQVSTWEIALSMHPTKNCPAYDLGYLLRKLQTTDESFYEGVMQLKMSCLRQKNYETNGTASIEYAFQWRGFQQGMSDFICNATIPEDAAAKLCIELLKQGILTRLEQEEMK